MGREASDEFYVLDLCDQALGETGLRQHRFDWLLGDPGTSGQRAQLPVDGYGRLRTLSSNTASGSTTNPSPISTSPTG